ncbi:MAG: HlyD family type I secretion periplasmic adaptor subunit [Rhodobacteraceae bacterium]|nr:HlyD family type I secretion periplasmic adaptor subunit [Paracoccaceae bacterium]MCF8515798.1 HlyD family type I secretion periplasmic adaptor subunit [Paracoccaceae bacterium]MCF8520043.1 HlyD family type I secretion periplasmic adaptor subunit [Paracoccaceae bacterium]
MAHLSLTSGSAPMEDITWVGRIGLICSVTMMAAMFAWAQFTLISGAVIAPGQVTVPGRPRVVQSLDGGVVEKIEIANGDTVVAGQVLLRLDPTLIKVKLDVATSRLAEALALRARLAAEQQNLQTPVFDKPKLPFAAPDTTEAELGQLQIFNARAELRRGRQDQLVEREAQIANQIVGIVAQTTAGEEQLGLLERELANVEALFAKKMVRKSELLDLQSRRAGLEAQIAGNRAEEARLTNATRDAQIETIQAERAFQEQVATELRATVTSIEELVLEIVTLSEQLNRVNIRAPSDGMVHELQITTEGGVVGPGEVILQIVPQSGGVEFETHLLAQDLERVHIGQRTELVFPSLDQRTTPRLTAEVTKVSPAAIVDPQTGQSFYRLTVTVTPTELARLGNVEVMPGMPVQAFLQTGDRSVLSYLLAPLSRQLSIAFREE